LPALFYYTVFERFCKETFLRGFSALFPYEKTAGFPAVFANAFSLPS